jgi:circadian clock protein KaiB
MTPETTFRFRLYVAGDTPNSAQALRNLTALCMSNLPGSHETEVVDVFDEPMRALAEGILMTPTLLKLSPGPVRRIVGTLSDEAIVLQALGVQGGQA